MVDLFVRILISCISMICGALWSVDKRSSMHGRLEVMWRVFQVIRLKGEVLWLFKVEGGLWA